MIVNAEDRVIDDKIQELLDLYRDKYGSEIERCYSRHKAENIIRSAVWAYSSRVDQMIGVYAVQQLFDALELKDWTYREDEAAVLAKYRKKRDANNDSLTGENYSFIKDEPSVGD